MTVGELRAALEKMPDDALVVVDGWWGRFEVVGWGGQRSLFLLSGHDGWGAKLRDAGGIGRDHGMRRVVYLPRRARADV